MSMKRFAIVGAVLAALTGVAIAANVGDRLQSPVLVGNSAATTKQLGFDTGNGNGNAYIKSTTAEDLQLGPGGGTAMTLLPSSFVGIGTTVPHGQLEVAGNILIPTDQLVYSYNGGTSSNARSYVYLLGSTEHIVLGTNGSDRLTIDSAGNATFDKQVIHSDVVTINPPNISGTQEALELDDNGSGAGEGLFINWDDGSHSGAARMGSVGLATGADLVLYANPANSGTPSEGLRVKGPGGGVQVVGGGNATNQNFKVAVFTGSLTTGTSATVTAPSGNILSVMGWNSTNFVPINDSGTTATNNLKWLAGSSNTNVVVDNPNSVTQAYIVVMFYL